MLSQHAHGFPPMANLLGIAVPRTAAVPLREGVRTYVRRVFPCVDAAVFEEDIEAWERLRTACIALPHAPSSLDTWSTYAAQLTALAPILDTNAGTAEAAHTPLDVPFAWASGYDERAPLTTYRTLRMERAFVLLRLAALYSQLGQREPRSDKESIRLATAYFQVGPCLTQHAAGTLSLLAPDLTEGRTSLPAELTAEGVRCLRPLMLAHAQECYWQKAAQGTPPYSPDGLKDGTVAKLAHSAAALYAASAAAARTSALPPGWKNYVLVKQYHFTAAAHYRKSRADLAEKRYGDELGRLDVAHTAIEKALALPKHTLPTQAVLDDLRGLQTMVEMNRVRAERDNQLIYLQPTTPELQLPALGTADMVHEMVPSAFTDLVQPWFARLRTYGVDVAVHVYHDRQEQLLASDIVPRLDTLQAKVDALYAELCLPARLDELESPRTLPRAWRVWQRALEQQGGSQRLVRKAQDVQHSAALCHDLLHESHASLFRARPHQPEPQLAEQHALQTHWREYERTMAEAADSDAHVQAQLETLLPTLAVLEGGEARMLAHLAPASALLERARQDTIQEARALRAAVEQLDDLRAVRRDLVHQVRDAIHHDAIRPRLLARAQQTPAASVDPADLDHELETSMEAYAVYTTRLTSIHATHTQRMDAVRVCAARLLACPAVSHAFHEHDRVCTQVADAYQRLATLDAHLDEGHAFYARLLPLLRTFHEAVRAWRA